MKDLGGLVSIIGTFAIGALVVVACGGDDVVTQTYTPDGGTSSGGSSGATSSSGSGTSSGGASSSGSIDTVAAYAGAYCKWLAKCSSATFLQYWGDEATCETFFHDAETKKATLAGFATTPTQYQDCAAKLDTAACDEATVAECQLKGTLADATPCGVAAQCSGGACVKTAFAACGKCAALGGEGAECGTGRPECQAGLGCTPSTQKCTKPLAEGADCTAGGAACASGLKCISKKCAKPLAVGGDCSGALAGACATGLFCADDHTCQALASKPAALGDACEDLTLGCKLSSCDVQLSTAKCVALVAEGGDCGSRALCQIGLTCRTGKCVKDDPSTCK